VHFVQLVEVKVGSLDNFNFSNLNVLDGVDWRDFLSDLFLDNFTGEEVKYLGGVGLCNFFCDYLIDLSSDDFLLRRKSIVSFALLICRLSCEGNNKYSKNISILRFYIRDSLNQSFSLFNEGAKLITSSINSVETGNRLSSLGLINNQFNLSPVEGILVRSKIGLHLADDSTFNTIFDFL
jgi:hypothetical protein